MSYRMQQDEAGYHSYMEAQAAADAQYADHLQQLEQHYNILVEEKRYFELAMEIGIERLRELKGTNTVSDAITQFQDLRAKYIDSKNNTTNQPTDPNAPPPF